MKITYTQHTEQIINQPQLYGLCRGHRLVVATRPVAVAVPESATPGLVLEAHLIRLDAVALHRQLHIAVLFLLRISA